MAMPQFTPQQKAFMVSEFLRSNNINLVRQCFTNEYPDVRCPSRIRTGVIKGTSRESLLKEAAWVKLRSRRSDHKLFMMFKILNNLAPPYLLQLRPEHIRTKLAYTLRTHDDLCVPFARTERLQKSFAISSIKLWNSLPLNVQTSESLPHFKTNLKIWRDDTIPNTLFYLGNRYASILHTHFRLFHCTLNHYLFLINCVPSPLCSCGSTNETVSHFFFDCGRYAAHRAVLLASAAHLLGSKWLNSTSKMRLSWFLNGHPDVSQHVNANLFLIVQNFIVNTKRFC
jgi:hypothetical protein